LGSKELAVLSFLVACSLSLRDRLEGLLPCQGAFRNRFCFAGVLKGIIAAKWRPNGRETVGMGRGLYLIIAVLVVILLVVLALPFVT
jgi:hypothetical protein